MRKIALLLCGLTPFLFGGIQNWAMMTRPDTVSPFKLIGVGVLLLWFCFAFVLGTNKDKQTMFLLNLPAFAVLVLLFVQEILLSAYWMNPVGMWTQLFFLPLINIGFALTFWAHNVFTAYAAAFLLMLLSSFLGCRLRRKLQKNAAA